MRTSPAPRAPHLVQGTSRTPAARRRPVLAVLATGLVALLAACGASSGDSAGTAPAPGVVPGEVAPDRSGSGAAPGDGAAEFPGTVDETTDREIITTGRVEVTVDDAREAASEVAARVERAGGRVDSRSERAGDDAGTGWAELVVRIPAAELSGVLDSFDDLGTVESISQEVQDVTEQVRDVAARIGALETSLARLEQFLLDSSTTRDLLEVEQMITQRQSELESLQARQRTVLDQVALSTYSVSLYEESVSPTPEVRDFWDGLTTGWDSLLAAVAGLLVAFGTILPWLVPLGIIVWVVLLIRGARRRRRATRPTPPPPPPLAPAPPAYGSAAAHTTGHSAAAAAPVSPAAPVGSASPEPSAPDAPTTPPAAPETGGPYAGDDRPR